MLGHWFVLPYGSDPTGIVIIVSMWTLLQWLCKQAPYCNVWFANTVGDIYVVVICCLSLFFFFFNGNCHYIFCKADFRKPSLGSSTKPQKCLCVNDATHWSPALLSAVGFLHRVLRLEVSASILLSSLHVSQYRIHAMEFVSACYTFSFLIHFLMAGNQLFAKSQEYNIYWIPLMC